MAKQVMGSRCSWSRVAVVGLVPMAGLLLTQNVLALELGGELGAKLIYTDNAAKQDRNKFSDTIEQVNAGVNAQHSSTKVDAKLNYQGRFEHYEDGTYGDKTYLDGAGTVNFKLLPERFYWQVQQSERTQTINSVAPDTPNNIDRRSIFQTGPQLIFRPSDLDTLNLSAQYTVSRYNTTSQQDSDRKNGAFTWTHSISQLTTASLVANYSKTEFDLSLQDYNEARYGLKLERLLKNGSVGVEYGIDNMDRNNFDDINSYYLTASGKYKVGGSNFGLSYTREFTDTSVGLALNNQFQNGFDSGESELSTVDIVKRERLQANYQFSTVGGRSTVNASVYGDSEEYQTSPQKEDQVGASLAYRYELSSEWSTGMSVAYSRVDQKRFGIKSAYTNLDSSLSLGWQVLKNFRVSGLLKWVDRKRDEGPASEYQEARVSLGVLYTLGGE